MSATYYLLNKTRNILYSNMYQNHSRFWAVYLQSLYPHDDWVSWSDYDDNPLVDIMNKYIEKHQPKHIDLLDKEGFELREEIMKKMEEYAIKYLKEGK